MVIIEGLLFVLSAIYVSQIIVCIVHLTSDVFETKGEFKETLSPLYLYKLILKRYNNLR